jgi:hypothetical protein
MADLDFRHHVSQIPQGEQLPNAVPRREKIQSASIPDFQGTLDKYGEATNWMSEVGSLVAQKSSDAIATKLGGELGKNPQGELGPSFTNFDKELAQSYAVQAQSTLGLQAHKLIMQSNLELAQQPRLSSEMIAKTQQSTFQGLEKIFSLAPESVRPHLEHQYGSIMINQNEHLVERMLREQKEDQRNNTILASETNAQNAYAFGLSGNIKAGESVI